ncbi:PepSY domain-containing protein [Sandaracinobacteroides sp. A072]|uniref:PepSY domain-containing protein n=1 Tax=Sandaracinobacteroides sp. A072 TaxID=3461146 RepID=UPI004042C646
MLLPALLLSFATAAHANDDRQPTPGERTAIEKVLRAAGYTSWEDIELDDGRWEVDNALLPNGSKYDLKLRPSDLKIIRTELDD